MSGSVQRTVSRWVHIVFGLPILGYIYGPPAEVAPYRDYFRFGFVPVLVVSGLWLWKGHVVRRMFSKGSREETR